MYLNDAEHRWVSLKEARQLLDKRMRGFLNDIKALGVV